MDKIIIEESSVCKLVRTGWESNGYGAFGEPESSSYKYVTINNKIERIYNGWFIIHDGEKVLDTEPKSTIPDKYLIHLDEKFARKKLARKYKNYIELKEEFDQMDPDSLKDIKRDLNIEKILG
jgi:hypothetical protein